MTRKGCHLCDEALNALRSVGIEPEQRDVDADPALLALYDFRVPLVMVDGVVVAEGKISATALLGRVQQK